MIKSQKLTGGQAAVKSLKKEHVKHVFGLIGSKQQWKCLTRYTMKKIKFIGVRDERTGTHMADGYERVLRTNQELLLLVKTVLGQQI